MGASPIPSIVLGMTLNCSRSITSLSMTTPSALNAFSSAYARSFQRTGFPEVGNISVKSLFHLVKKVHNLTLLQQFVIETYPLMEAINSNPQSVNHQYIDATIKNNKLHAIYDGKTVYSFSLWVHLAAYFNEYSKYSNLVRDIHGLNVCLKYLKCSRKQFYKVLHYCGAPKDPLSVFAKWEKRPIDVWNDMLTQKKYTYQKPKCFDDMEFYVEYDNQPTPLNMDNREILCEDNIDILDALDEIWHQIASEWQINAKNKEGYFDLHIIGKNKNTGETNRFSKDLYSGKLPEWAKFNIGDDWESPHSIVGGDVDNPGVFENFIYDVNKHYPGLRVTNTNDRSWKYQSRPISTYEYVPLVEEKDLKEWNRLYK